MIQSAATASFATPLASDFRLLASLWATGVAVVTTLDARERPCGLTMNAVTTLSLEPMQYLICIDNRASTLPAVLESRRFGINFLGVDQAELSSRFAGKAADRFADVAYTRSVSGVPVLDGIIGFVECAVHTVAAGGDHRIIIGDVRHIAVPGGEPLLRFRGEYRKLL